MAIHLTAHCSQCDYDLSGLPSSGRCPECGQPYDRQTLRGVYRPEHWADRAERRQRRIRAIALGAAAAVVAASTGVCALGTGRPLPALMLGGLAAAVLGLGAWNGRRRGPPANR